MKKKNDIILIIALIITLLGFGYFFYYNYFNTFETNNFKHKRYFPKRLGFSTYGIDISKYQKEINWDKLESENIKFIFVKATEGTYIVDKKFKKNWDHLKESKYLFSAYHFYRPKQNWRMQAELFKMTVDLNKGNLPPVLDIETSNFDSKASLIKDLKNWLDNIHKHYNVRPIIYTNYNFYKQNLAGEFPDYYFWIANYNKFLAPHNIYNDKFLLWQYTEKGVLNGINNFVDINCVFGSFSKIDNLKIK